MAVRQESSPALSRTHLLEAFGGSSESPSMAEFDDDDDEFEDAEEEQAEATMNLHQAFEDCEMAIQKFFNNDVGGALHIMQPWKDISLYHSLGTAIFEFIPAMLTFDQNQIARALAAIKVTISICNRHRRSNQSLVETLGTMIRRPNYASYSDLEAHSELCYAEALLLQAAMTIMEGEDLTGFIKGTIKVRNCYNSYKECARILVKKPWESEASQQNFQSGVRLGVATFNVMISLLPPRVVSLLEFVGFTGNKSLGLQELMAGSRAPGLRSVLCDLTLLAYHLAICHFTGGEGDLTVCEEILEKQLQCYPDGVWFLLFKGRLQLLRGAYTPAEVTYTRCIDSQDMWKQFRHVCYWEIMWLNGLKMDWREASYYAHKLMTESGWSRTIYSYSRAAMMLQLNDELTSVERDTCEELMGRCALYKQRIAGKSLPMEKFMIRRSARFLAQSGRLVLPGLEMMCLWNMFAILAKNDRAAHNVLKLIETTRAEFCRGAKPWEGPYAPDNRALLAYLHGCCLAAMDLPRMALEVLDNVFEYKNDLKEDTFLLPYTVAEIAMCHYRLGDKERALIMLHNARKKFSGYSLESRLHFRLHSKMDIVKNAGKPDPKECTSSSK